MNFDDDYNYKPTPIIDWILTLLVSLVVAGGMILVWVAISGLLGGVK